MALVTCSFHSVPRFQGSSTRGVFQGFIPLGCRTVVRRMGRTHFIYLFINRRLGCVHYLAIMGNAAVSVHVRVFVWTSVSISPRSGIATSHGSSLFNIGKSCWTVFQRGCHSLHLVIKERGLQFLPRRLLSKTTLEGPRVCPLTLGEERP